MLTLSLLGPFQATWEGRPLTKFRTNKVQAMLIFLAMEPDQAHTRDALMELLWPDLPVEAARANLRQTLYLLRKMIPHVEAHGGHGTVPFLVSSRNTVQINPEATYGLDVKTFVEAQPHNGRFIPAQLETAAALYRGHFLSDFYLPHNNVFEAWAAHQRAKLQRQALETLNLLTNHYLDYHQFDKAQFYARQQLDIDNLRETAYYQLMTALIQAGERHEALIQYDICRQHLQDELGLEPTEAITRLHEQIQADTRPDISHQPPSATALPDKEGLLVFMFSDIENSTRLWDTYRQAMLSVLQHHNHILENQIHQYGGRILEHQGDGILAVFEGINPLPCALEIQKLIGQTDWGTIGELRVRIGLHGVPFERRGHDYFWQNGRYYGPVINHASRITDTGHGGQIVASASVKAMCPLPPDAYWQDLGTHQLKSLEEAQHIFGFRHPDLPHQEFPPLRTDANKKAATAAASEKPFAPLHQLPSPPTPFIGREKELAALSDLIHNPDVRLITLVGPGGMGKTRTSIEVATRHKEQFAHGVTYADLTPLPSSHLLVSTIATAVNLTLSGNTDPQQQLIDHLQDKELLLVLDNFEHLLDGAPLVSQMLHYAPQLKILVTSREPFNAPEEWLYPLDGLSFPASSDPSQQAINDTAVQLFIQRAQQVFPQFAVRHELPGIIRICQLVEGMPLALELAAVWVKMLSCADIATEIRQNLDFLTSTRRTSDPRHQSQRAVFEHSWQLLSNEERQALMQLSLFRGGFTRQAAQQIAQVALSTLYGLMNKSLIRRDQDRYSIHELLRQYAYEKLEAQPDLAATVRQQHAHYYGTFFQEREALWDTEQQGEILHLLRTDLQNVHLGWAWAASQQEAATLNLYIDSLLGFYTSLNWHQEGERVFRQAVEQLMDQAQLPAQATPTHQLVLGRLLARQALFSQYLGQPQKAHQLAQDSLSILRPLSAHQEIGFAYIVLGSISRHQGRYEEAQQFLTNCYDHLQHTDFQNGIATVALQLGDLAFTLGNYDQAQQWHRITLDIYMTIKKSWGVAQVTRRLGMTEQHIGRYHKAEAYYRRSLSLFQEIEHPQGVIACLNHLGSLAQQLTNYAQARRWFEESLALCREHNLEIELAKTLNHLGEIACILDAQPKAREYLYTALQVAARIQSPPLLLQALSGTAHLLMQTSDATTNSEAGVEEKLIKAFELLQLVLNHPATHQQIREAAQPRLAELTRKLPPHVVAQLQEQSQPQRLDTITQNLLTQGPGGQNS